MEQTTPSQVKSHLNMCDNNYWSIDSSVNWKLFWIIGCSFFPKPNGNDGRRIRRSEGWTWPKVIGSGRIFGMNVLKFSVQNFRTKEWGAMESELSHNDNLAQFDAGAEREKWASISNFNYIAKFDQQMRERRANGWTTPKSRKGTQRAPPKAQKHWTSALESSPGCAKELERGANPVWRNASRKKWAVGGTNVTLFWLFAVKIIMTHSDAMGNHKSGLTFPEGFRWPTPFLNWSLFCRVKKYQNDDINYKIGNLGRAEKLRESRSELQRTDRRIDTERRKSKSFRRVQSRERISIKFVRKTDIVRTQTNFST